MPDALLAGASTWPKRWGLSRILARSVHRHLGFGGSYEVIGWAVTGHAAATRAWAPAPVSWVGDFQVDPPLGVLRIDPVCLTPGPRGLTMAPPRALGLAQEESGRLAAAVAAEFRGRGIGVKVASPDRWYMTLPHLPNLPWRAPETVTAGSLLEYLPAGESGAELRRIINEIQIVLHDQPDNLARRSRRDPEVNSVWPWGWAPRPLPRAGAVVSRAYADHPYARGLAMLAGASVGEPGGNADEPSGAAVVVPPEGRESDGEWLEVTWGRPLYKAVARKRIALVRLVTPRGRVAEYGSASRRRLRGRKAGVV
jgi:hypothetical protein